MQNSWRKGFGRTRSEMKQSKNEMIHIGDGWALQGDEVCITLYKRRVTDKGKEQYDPKGYYNNYHEAYRAMVNKEIGPLNNVEKIIKAIDNLYDYVRPNSILGR